MIVRLTAPGLPEGPADLRRASRRGLDLLSASHEGVEVVEHGDARSRAAEVELVVREMEAAIPRSSFARAYEALRASPGASRIVPSGFFPGAARASETYTTVWELDEIGRAGGPAFDTSRAEPPPLELARVGGNGGTVAPRGFVVHSFAFRRAWDRPEVAALVPVSAREVLEVGCAEGALGEALTRRGARVTGVEPDAGAAAKASSRLSRVVALPVEEALEELPARFDAIVAADVLEHLEDPVGVLQRLAERLEKDGVLVLSVPNATNGGVLAGVLMGRWDLALEGVVADDHRTYAGLRGWTRVLQAGGFDVVSASPVEALSARARRFSPALLKAGLAAEDLVAVQWLVVARPGRARPTALELGPAASPTPYEIDLEDPLGMVRRCLDGGSSFAATLPNAVSAETMAALFEGDVVLGPSRSSLAAGVTAAALRERFEGSGLSTEVSHASPARISSALSAVVDEARALGLPVDVDALQGSSVCLKARRGPA